MGTLRPRAAQPRFNSIAVHDIQGGTLNTTSGGTWGRFQSGVTLDGSTAAGAVTVSTGSTYTEEGNSQTTILGTINNKGSILVNGGGGTNTYLFLGGNTTLSGAGTLTLSNTMPAVAPLTCTRMSFRP